jgi:hypothetical protein
LVSILCTFISSIQLIFLDLNSMLNLYLDYTIAVPPMRHSVPWSLLSGRSWFKTMYLCSKHVKVLCRKLILLTHLGILLFVLGKSKWRCFRRCYGFTKEDRRTKGKLHHGNSFLHFRSAFYLNYLIIFTRFS